MQCGPVTYPILRLSKLRPGWNVFWLVNLRIDQNSRAKLLFKGSTYYINFLGIKESPHCHKCENSTEILEKQIQLCDTTFNDEKPSQMGLNMKRDLLVHINEKSRSILNFRRKIIWEFHLVHHSLIWIPSSCACWLCRGCEIDAIVLNIEARPLAPRSVLKV